MAVQNIVSREGLVEKVAANGPRLKSWLAEGLAGIDAVGDIRGRGHFIAVELVANRDTRDPFDKDLKLFMKIRAQAMENGLICYPVGGNVDGESGDIVIFAPPYNCTDEELTEITDKGAQSINQVLQSEGLA